jgi:hypothetical protein
MAWIQTECPSSSECVTTSEDWTEALLSNLRGPYDAADMEMHPANRIVGNVRNNGSEVLACLDAGVTHKKAESPHYVADNVSSMTTGGSGRLWEWAAIRIWSA